MVENIDKVQYKENIPAVALRGLTILPGIVINFDVSREKSRAAIEKAMQTDEYLFLSSQKDAAIDDPTREDIYSVGIYAKIKQVLKLPEDVVRVMVQGESRARMLSMDEENDQYLSVGIEEIQTIDEGIDDIEREAMIRYSKELFIEFAKYFPKVGKTLIPHFESLNDLSRLLDEITMNMPIGFEKKQEILEADDLKNRYNLVSNMLGMEVQIAACKNELGTQIKERIEKNQREYILREQLRFIQEELGDDNSFSDSDSFQKELKKLKASKEVKEKIVKEIARFKNISSNSSESAVERGYIETLLEMPWDKSSKDNMNIKEAEDVLNADHYGLAKVKERILEFLAVKTLTKNGMGPIICLVGPPGTGKTSIAKSVAKALNKKYVRICLGGVRDEAEIRGHRKTYVGAMPGRIAVGLKQAGVNNPLMLLDEIDKVSNDYKGDTFSALLEVLDAEQNSKFRDHYVEIPIDLSNVFFIATANSVSTIPRPLLDRMEVIEVTSYTMNEKFHIAKEHLVEKQILKHGLSSKTVTISDSALNRIIQAYTREAGVRDLERKIGQVCRKVAKEIVQNEKKSIKISSSNLHKYLGKEKYSNDLANELDDVGIVRGLAWTSVGGDTLSIEVNVMPGKGVMELTGQLGEVMKESAMTAMSYVRSISEEYKIAPDYFKKHDFHIHIPEGAVPKDGPSAGITMATALLSAVTNVAVKASVAMTGEITLRGRVLPIGGLKEKVLAAKVAGIKTIIVPAKNEKDIEEISMEIRSGLTITYAKTMKDVLAIALVS